MLGIIHVFSVGQKGYRTLLNKSKKMLVKRFSLKKQSTS